MASFIRGLAAALDGSRCRLRLYAVLVAGFFGLAVLVGRAAGPSEGMRFNLVTSDGRFYYAYLPSLVLDGDLDFTNQIREHWGPEFSPALLETRTARGFVRNKYPIGLALTLLPFFLLAHGAAHALFGLTGSNGFACDGYSPPYQVFCLAGTLALSWLTLALVDRLLVTRFRVRGRSAAAGVCLTAGGTHLAWYCFREPFMVHAVSLFWCTLVIFLTDRALGEFDARRLSWWALPLLALGTAMAVVCRPTNLFLLPFLACVLWRLGATGMVRPALRLLPLILAGGLPVLAQLAVWWHTTGHWVAYTYGQEGFVWSRPALWQTLFSSRHGLLVWSPLLLLALGGVAGRLRRGGPDRLLVCYLLAFGILWYCNSAWHMWWFGDAFGARAFLELSSLFVLGLALGFDPPRPRPWRLCQAAFVLLAVGYNWMLMWLYFTNAIPHDTYLF
jgi:hypothetical protein